MSLPIPRDHYGFELGADRKLARWPQIVSYFERLAAASGRIQVETLGETTEGRPFLGAVITSEANMRRLEELRQIHCRLADPRGLGAEESERLIAEAKSVVMISCSIHASEVGGTQVASEIAYELCAGDDEVTRQVLDNVIFVFVPCLNPDGLEIVADYYESTLGKPWEGGTLPWLYHKYVGHDNNRDWFMLTQVENQLAIDRVQNVWHPMIVFDMHQMQPNGFRFFLPPYIDPFDPNVDPLMQHQTTVLGSAMIMDLLAAGKTGITHSIIFDCFSPSRAYQHYHGGIRILSEAASCKVATPVEVPFRDLAAGRDGSDPKVASLAHPAPWPGGTWRLRDIMDYDRIAAWACLKHAARYRDAWVRNFAQVSRNALTTAKPYAYIVPPRQRDPHTAHEMLEVLQRGMVEVHEATAPFVADGIMYPAGSRVILMAQPYGRYAKTLLERQTYPDLRLYPGGPPKPPYDITAHTLPLQMDVRCVEVLRPFAADLTMVSKLKPPVAAAAGEVLAMAAEDGYVLCPNLNNSVRAVMALLGKGYEAYRACEPMGPEGKESPGTFYLPQQDGLGAELEAMAQGWGLRVAAADPVQLEDATMLMLRLPRLGIYRSYQATADEGWTRFVLDDYGVPYVTLTDADVRAGGLGERFDSVLLPGQSPEQITSGLAPGSADPKYTGGLGELGRAALRDFVDGGGTLICLGPACDWAVESLGLRVRNVLKGLRPEEFYLPGSMLRMLLDPTHPVAYGMPQEAIALHVASPAYAVDEGEIVGRYPPAKALQSGWVLGEKHIQDRAAIVDVPYGRGTVILLGPRVQFRAQTRGAYKLLFNSILWASSDEVILE
jgi:hypothetical protein